MTRHARTSIDPRSVSTPSSRHRGRVRSSDYSSAEMLGMAGAFLLVLCLVGMATMRLLTGHMGWP